MVDPRLIDPGEELVSREALSEPDVDQVVRVMAALQRWREAEQRANEASRRCMRLGESDMRALRFIIVERNQGRHVTAGAISRHLGISTASTTKLLDRLAAAEHIRRTPHPTDRRALAIVVAEETHRAARETVGRHHARRFDVAAALQPADRETVIAFLNELSDVQDVRTAPVADG